MVALLCDVIIARGMATQTLRSPTCVDHGLANNSFPTLPPEDMIAAQTDLERSWSTIHGHAVCDHRLLTWSTIKDNL